MSRKNQEMKKLRREVEVLRAQGTKVKTFEPSRPSVPSEPSTNYVREDLRRSLLITAAILALIGGLALSQSYWG